jgi:hypothetical protein
MAETTANKYPDTISNTSDVGELVTAFGNLKGLKTEHDYAETILPVSPILKSATLELKKYGLKLKNNAQISKVIVEFRQRKLYVGNNDKPTDKGKNIGDIPAPKVMLIYNNKKLTDAVSTDYPALTTASTVTKSFKVNGLTPAMVNDDSFGVRIAYPKSNNDYSAFIRLAYVRVRVVFSIPGWNEKVVYPNKVEQTNTKDYRQFDNLENIKKNDGTAIAKKVAVANKNYSRPSKITCTEFNLGLNEGDVVKRIYVELRHARSKINEKDKGLGAFGGPQIVIMHQGKHYTTVDTAKAPPQTGDDTRVLYSLDIPYAIANSPTFGVRVAYPENSSKKYEANLHLRYVRLRVEYVSPSFNITLQGSNEAFNKEDYSLTCVLSDSNRCGHNPAVSFSLPLGFSYNGFNGPGNIVQESARQLIWYPAMSLGTGSNSVTLNLSTNASLSSQAPTLERTFSAYEWYSEKGANLTTVIKNRPIDATEIVDDVTSTEIDASDATDEITFTTLVIEENFDFDILLQEGFTMDPLEVACRVDGVYTYDPEISDALIYDFDLLLNGTEIDKEVTVEDNLPYYWTNNSLYIRYCAFTDNACLLTAIPHQLGYYNLQFSVRVENTASEIPLYNEYLKNYYEVKPSQADLGVPYATIIPFTNEEELNRLGHEFPYVFQNNLTVNTEAEEHVRDWYTNFRLGVFNNPILANITTYMTMISSETSQSRNMQIPKNIDITDAILEITSEDSIQLVHDETTYDLPNDTFSLDEFDYEVPLILNQTSQEDTVIMNVTVKTDEDVVLYTTPYHVTFNAEETKDIEEINDDSTDYTNLTDIEILSNAEYWGNPPSEYNVQKSVDCEFIYNKNYPMYLIVTGDFPNGNPLTNTVEFEEPCIIEKSVYTRRETPGKYPVPIEEVIGENTLAELHLSAFESSTPIVIYDFPLPEDYGTLENVAVRGIEVLVNVERCDEQVIYAKLKAPNGKIGNRSIVLSDDTANIDENNILHIGGNGDLWQFSTSDIVDLQKWEIEITNSNSLTGIDSNIILGNAQIVFYIEQIDSQVVKCYIDGEDTSYYGVFLKDVKIPAGLNTEVEYLQINGTDTNDAYLQNIEEKTIELEFDIGDNCDLEGSTLSLQQITKLLINERDELNRPIPKRIEFSHHPGLFWEYIIKDVFDNDIEISSYSVKAKLIVPSGTAYTKESTVTNTIGYVQGLTGVAPLISVKPTAAEIEIRENHTGQKFNLYYPADWKGKIVQINCEDREVYLKDNEDDTDYEDISKYADFNTDWFILHGEYEFEATNASIRLVEYNERW